MSYSCRMVTHRIPALIAALVAVAGLATASPSSVPPASVSPELWPEGAATAVNPRVDAFVADLIAHMSLEEKIGQMIQADIASITPADLKTYKLGSILAGGNAAPGNNVRSTPQAWLDLTDAFYRASLAGGDAAHAPIPIIFGIDAVHGNAKVIGATIFPHNVGLGAAHDADLIASNRRVRRPRRSRVPESIGHSRRPSQWCAMCVGADPTRAIPNRLHWWPSTRPPW